ncbi:hypothetical protein [Streptococcus massiliensis]|uniref:hypothetical protein n=1 Tax=Streptococcus massiliensis TaxID=313439 RepID=UPI0003A3D43C|nr:hypothetical protein [Streptococcus massiliensis]
MVKLFDLCYSEYAWDSLSKWFIVQFYFTRTIATMQKSNGFAVAFFGDKGLLSQALSYFSTEMTPRST